MKTGFALLHYYGTKDMGILLHLHIGKLSVQDLKSCRNILVFVIPSEYLVIENYKADMNMRTHKTPFVIHHFQIMSCRQIDGCSNYSLFQMEIQICQIFVLNR